MMCTHSYISSYDYGNFDELLLSVLLLSAVNAHLIDKMAKLYVSYNIIFLNLINIANLIFVYSNS